MKKPSFFAFRECIFTIMVHIVFLFSGVSNLLNCHKDFKQPICQGLQEEKLRFVQGSMPYIPIKQQRSARTMGSFCSEADGQRGPAACALWFMGLIKTLGSVTSTAFQPMQAVSRK